MSAITTAREALKRILKKRETIEATAAEREMAEHLQRRNELREQLKDEQLEAERSEREHEKNLAALHAIGERYTRQELDGNTELRDELLRLSKAVNNRKPCFTSDAAERLISSCLDSDLQEQSRIASENLRQAQQALTEARSAETQTWERMSQARRDIIETLGSVGRQFGREGQRWQKTENENGVFVESVGRPQDGGIHEQNITFINGNLSHPNRVIREGKAADFGIERLTVDVAALREQLAAIHAAMIASDI